MSEQEAAPLRVLLVEDDADHVILIRRAIGRAAPRTTIDTVDDGAAALERLRAGDARPDLILLDINMPGLSGLEVLEQVKADDRLKYIPVVMLTSSELLSDVTRAYELGAGGYVAKGSLAHDLQAVLGHTLLYWSVMRRAPRGGETR